MTRGEALLQPLHETGSVVLPGDGRLRDERVHGSVIPRLRDALLSRLRVSSLSMSDGEHPLRASDTPAPYSGGITLDPGAVATSTFDASTGRCGTPTVCVKLNVERGDRGARRSLICQSHPGTASKIALMTLRLRTQAPLVSLTPRSQLRYRSSGHGSTGSCARGSLSRRKDESDGFYEF